MVDTRPAASRWRGSAVREPAARPLARGAIDVAALSRYADARAREARQRVIAAAIALAAAAALLAALAAAGELALSFRGPPAAFSGDEPR